MSAVRVVNRSFSRACLLVVLVASTTSPSVLADDSRPVLPACHEEDGRGCYWDCETMGNHRCGPGVGRFVVNGSSR